jgi:hypothetical protein
MDLIPFIASAYNPFHAKVSWWHAIVNDHGYNS